MKYRPLVAFVAGCTVLTACQGLKEALTAHVDVAAHAASQELSVSRLADLLGNAKLPVPVSKENAGIVASLWVNYQLVGQAAARGDSLSDKKLIDSAAAALTDNMRLRRYMDAVVKTFPVDSGNEAAYDRGANDLLAARHILFMFPAAATGSQKDSVKKKAESVRPSVTSDNFVAMVTKYSGEPNAAQRGGGLGVFSKGQMLPEFSNAVAALKPGEISQPVATQYGYHVIQRLTWDQAKQLFTPLYAQKSLARAESTYLANLDKSGEIELKPNAPALAKSATADMAKYAKDKTTMATFKGGEMTVGQFLNWVQGLPPQARIAQQIQQAPDSAIRGFLKSMARNQVMLQKADSAKIVVSAEERAGLYGEFAQMVMGIWQALGVDPRMLADSAKTVAQRERLAAARVEATLDRIMANQAQPVPIPAPLETILREKYDWSVNAAGIDRSVQRATKLRTAADSARAASQPKSQVPLPGSPGAQPPVPGQNPPAATAPPSRGSSTTPPTKKP